MISHLNSCYVVLTFCADGWSSPGHHIIRFALHTPMCTDVMFYLPYLLTTIQPSDDPSTISLTHNIKCVSSSSSHGILSCLLTYVLVHLSRSTERPFFIGLARVKIKVVDVRDAKTVSIIQQTNKRTTLLTSGKQTLVTSTNIQRSTIAGKLQPLQQLQRHTR